MSSTGNAAASLPYEPAPHLVATSMLSSAELSSQFKDFCNNLPYASAAPGLVFERIVANLSASFQSAFKEEFDKYVEALDNSHASYERLEKEVAELRRLLAVTGELDQAGEQCATDKLHHAESFQTLANAPAPTAASPPTVEESTGTPNIGTFGTLELRPHSVVRAATSKLFTFPKPYSHPPGLAIGLSMLDIGNHTHPRIKTYASHTRGDSFEIHIDSWLDTKIYAARSHWLEIPADDADFQFGTYNTLEDQPDNKPTMNLWWSQHKSHNERQVVFKHPYDSPPVVVVWLAGLDMSKDKKWRVRTFATDVSRTGFSLHVDTWGDSWLYSGIATWVAYPTGKRGVASGHLKTSAEGSHGGYEKFQEGLFTKAPRVMLALDELEMDNWRVLRVAADAQQVDEKGMAWSLKTWMDSILYSAGASYIALG